MPIESPYLTSFTFDGNDNIDPICRPFSDIYSRDVQDHDKIKDSKGDSHILSFGAYRERTTYYVILVHCEDDPTTWGFTTLTN